MDDFFETLCFALDDELERQENILAVCRAQGQAARAHDIEYLEAKTLALVALMQEAVQAEKTRGLLLGRMAEHLRIPNDRQTLSELIRIAPEPWRGRLSHVQTRLQDTLRETHAVVLSNGGVLRSGLRVLTRSLQALGQCAALDTGYDATGMEPVRKRFQPKVLDQKG